MIPWEEGLPNGVVTEKYLWQGLTRLLAVYDGGDNLIMRFEYADGRMPVAMTKDGVTYYLTCDQVGSLRVIADTSGTAVKQIDYDSFGNIINDTNPTFTIPFGFAGGLFDKDTGLVRFGYRDYDPDTGRWTAKDPILFTGGDTDLYGYCLSDPVNLVDPWGLWFIDVGVSGSATGTLGPGGTVGLKIGPSGVHFYYGFGLGIGAGASATIHTGNPCADVSVTGIARGGYPVGGIPVGGQLDVGIRQKTGLSAGAGAGLGLGFGASVTATHTIKLFSW